MAPSGMISVVVLYLLLPLCTVMRSVSPLGGRLWLMSFPPSVRHSTWCLFLLRLSLISFGVSWSLRKTISPVYLFSSIWLGWFLVFFLSSLVLILVTLSVAL